MATKFEKVHIKKFKCIEDLEADLTGSNIILLVGDNGVGKSSFIQFIEIALGKSDAVPPGVTGKGEVWIDKEGNRYKFNVDIKDGKSKVTIEELKEDGSPGMRDSRKGTLSAIIGAVEFDINEFVEMSKTEKGRKQQVEIFKSFLPKELNEMIEKIEANINAHFEERTDIGRRKRELTGAIKENALNVLQDSELEKFKEIDTSTVAKELEATNKANEKIRDVKNRNEERKQNINKLADEIKEMQLLLDRKKDEQHKTEELRKQADQWLLANKEVDTAALQKQLSNAGETNKKAATAAKLLEQRKLFKKLEEEEGEKTVLIDSERDAIQTAIKDNANVVQGLIYENEQLVYNGVPVNDQSLSSSEIMELGLRIKMAENPGMPLLIKRGESLGKKRLEEIMKIAKDNDLQLIMEQVQRGQEKLIIELVPMK